MEEAKQDFLFTWPRQMEAYGFFVIQKMALLKRHVFKQEEMIIGAPGVFDWTGSVIRVSDDSHMIDNPIPARRRRSVDVIRFGRTVVGDVTQLNQLQPYDYFGYSVYSGHFFSDGSSSYVGGAPRGADMKGKVIINTIRFYH